MTTTTRQTATEQSGLKDGSQRRPRRPLLQLWRWLGWGFALARARSARPDGPPAALRGAAPSGLALYKSMFLPNEPN